MQSLPIVHKGFNYSQDGPGNRLVYHLRGCNMTCPWCSNPEAMSVEPDSKDQLAGPGEILRQALSAAPILIDGGGVTFTGGEPTLHMPALAETLGQLREAGVHAAIETNGTSRELEALLPLLSLLIIDLKHHDEHKHKQATGLYNRQVIQNIRAAGRFGLPVWVRTPLIGGFNDNMEDIEGFLHVYRTLDTANMYFELLPYHEYGKPKWEQQGRPYTVTGGAVTEGTVRAFEQAYTAAGLRVIRT